MIGTGKRSATAPEVPTFAEAGFTAVSASAWYGLFAPIAIPREIVAKLHAEVVKALALPDVREHFAQAGIDLIVSTPEQLGAQLRIDIEKFTRIARDSNIRLESRATSNAFGGRIGHAQRDALYSAAKSAAVCFDRLFWPRD